jgi:hypothetical protein
MIGPTDLFHPSPTPHFETFHVFLIYCPKRPSYLKVEDQFILQVFFNYEQLARHICATNPISNTADLDLDPDDDDEVDVFILKTGAR